MNTTTSVVVTGAIVAFGQWVQDKQITIKMVVGIGLLALFFAILGEANAEFARQMALLVLVGAIFIYGPDVAKGLGVS